jgi:membrane-associated phospholipid phosphatase
MRRLAERLAALWRFKAALAVSVGIMFCVPYFLIGHYPQMPVRELPLTWLDRAVPFHPLPWVWVYQSAYLPINVIPWLAKRREDLRRYLRGLAALAIVSFAIFIVLPVRGPRPAVEQLQGMYRVLVTYDSPLNCLPSLHAGLMVYALMFARRIAGDEIPRALRVLMIAWTALVFYSTLAIKAHYAVDLAAGVMLAGLADWWAWRATPATTPAHTRLPEGS